MDVCPRMRRARQVDTWSNALDCERFTTEELAFEPRVQFWDDRAA